MTQLWCNGRWLDFSDFQASPLDRGSMLGLGLFETMLALDGAPVFIDRHLARLRKGCERLRWDLPCFDLAEVALELLARNGLTSGRARVRLALSGGGGPINDLAPGADRIFWMMAVPASDVPSSVSTLISPWLRNENSPVAGMKCASYAENLVALDHARRLGFDETIFLNTQGHVCEAATGNLFFVKNGILHTPALHSGCLPGVTREVVMELAGDHQIPCVERDVLPDDLHCADEIFLTSATRGPVNVIQLDTRNFTPGPLAARLRELWTEKARRGICG